MRNQRNGYKSSSDSEMVIISKAKDLVKYTLNITNNTNRYPKKWRFTMVNRIQERVIDIFECLLEANELDITDPVQKRERNYKQAKALTYCKELLFFIELSLDTESINITTATCEHWTGLVLNVKYMCASWLKKDRQRS